MFLSLCMITKGDDELSKLKNALESIIEYVDEVCITTNGKSITETEKYLKTLSKVKHSHLDWSDDFALQRNFNFSQISEKTDYILWMDSDDVIVGGEYLRDIAKVSLSKGFDTVFFTYWYGALFDGEPSADTFIESEITQRRERLIRPNRMIWKKRIHETPVPLDPETFKYSKVEHSKEWPIAWLHLGADRNITEEILRNRMDRNRRLLELELEDERKEGQPDPRTILYLMKIYAESDDPETLNTCISMGYEYIGLSGWDEERAICYQLMARCMGSLGHDEKAKTFLHNAIKEFPYSPILYLYLARTCFNLGDYRAMEHWMRIGMSIDTEGNDTSMHNVLEIKVLSAELMLNFYLHAKKDARKAYESARLLNFHNPTPQNKTNVELLYNQSELDKASQSAHEYIKYLESLQRESLITRFVSSMPIEMRSLPFATYYENKYSPARVWASNEICYYASFGRPHFEKWDGNSLIKGIGGSETAVVRLAEEWTKMGYRVTVFCDPVRETEINGVKYLPYHRFNHKDKFNIFIQWRSSHLAKSISAKKFLVDLHDVYHESSHSDKLNQIDKLMVKTQFHADYAPNIAESKKEVISNGI